LGNHSPANSPLHGAIRRNERRHNIQDLVPPSSHSIPDSLGEETGEGTLTIGAHGVLDNAFARLATTFVGVAPAADVPSTPHTLAMPFSFDHFMGGASSA
jgi:hypothetical protein